ncbi:MAG: SPASM domain-containing protein [Candidatus Eremiobacteraeota bacterium]|nr:SPASM domain-containing protein [Candidatus Eremiobacteraeota bacterium]
MTPPENSETLIYGQFGSFGCSPLKSSQRRESDNYLSSSLFAKLLEEVSQMRSNIYLWGSEPLSHPYIASVLETIGERKIYCVLATRGHNLENLAPSLVENQIAELVISLDGTQQVYKNLNPRSNAYEEMESGMRALLRVRKEKKSRNPLITGTLMITKENYHFLSDILDLAEDLGIERFIFCHPFTVDEQKGHGYNNFLMDTFNSPSLSWERYLLDREGLEPSALLRDIMRIRKKPHRIPYSFFPALKPWQISDYYKDYDYTSGIERCHIPWYAANVLENGEIVTCNDYPDIIIGHINEDTIASVWNNESMRHFRTELIRQGRLPICSRCSGLYAV